MKNKIVNIVFLLCLLFSLIGFIGHLLELHVWGTVISGGATVFFVFYLADELIRNRRKKRLTLKLVVLNLAIAKMELHSDRCICGCISSSWCFITGKDLLFHDVFVVFPEFLEYKPEKKTCRLFWFNLGGIGTMKRLLIMNKVRKTIEYKLAVI